MFLVFVSIFLSRYRGGKISFVTRCACTPLGRQFNFQFDFYETVVSLPVCPYKPFFVLFSQRPFLTSLLLHSLFNGGGGGDTLFPQTPLLLLLLLLLLPSLFGFPTTTLWPPSLQQRDKIFPPELTTQTFQLSLYIFPPICGLAKPPFGLLQTIHDVI